MPPPRTTRNAPKKTADDADLSTQPAVPTSSSLSTAERTTDVNSTTTGINGILSRTAPTTSSGFEWASPSRIIRCGISSCAHADIGSSTQRISTEEPSSRTMRTIPSRQRPDGAVRTISMN